MFTPSIIEIQEVLSKKGFPFYQGGKPYHLNIIGIKNDDKLGGLFNDTILVCYVDMFGTLQVDYFPAILTPVDILQLTSKNRKDIILLEEGHYHNSFEKRLEKGAKLAPIKNIRYKRGSFKPELTLSPETFIGIPNFRIEGQLGCFSPENISVWSNGSQYIEKDFEILLFLLEKSFQNHGNIFSYTLLNRQDFDK